MHSNFIQLFYRRAIHCASKHFKKVNFSSPLGFGIGHFGMWAPPLPSPSRLRPIPWTGGVLVVHRRLPPTTRSPPWTPRWPTACSGRPSWSPGPWGKHRMLSITQWLSKILFFVFFTNSGLFACFTFLSPSGHSPHKHFIPEPLVLTNPRDPEIPSPGAPRAGRWSL